MNDNRKDFVMAKEKQPSLKMGVLWNTLYQILVLILPLITAPYVARTIGPSGTGVFSFTSSIQYYFSMFAALGTATYGSREIARSRDDATRRTQLFWEIEGLTVISSSLMMICWWIFIAFNQQYQTIYMILSLNLVATMLDISWFFTGLEQFKSIVTKNSILKILGVIAIFTFVKDAGDLNTYVFIMTLTTVGANASMWLGLRKHIVPIQLKHLNLKHHFKETLIYFVPTIATSIYTVLDKSIIGIITNNAYENGYYEQATKIINICKSLTFVALNSVLGSRIAYLFVDHKVEEIKSKIRSSIDYISFIGIGMWFGLLAVSKVFVPIFFGDGYERVATLLYVFSPIIVIIGISNCLGSQYYTPSGRQGQSARYLIVGSVVNLVFNFIFIRFFGAFGAALSSVIAEGVITFLYVKNCQQFYSFKDLFKTTYKKLLSGCVMWGTLLAVQHYISCASILGIAFLVILGVMVYCVTGFLLRDSFIMNTLEKVRR